MDLHHGMHTIEGNKGSTNYRTMRVAGTTYLPVGARTSVHVFSSTDNSFRFQQESGFSCHRLRSRDPCPACNIANSNRVAGASCACKNGFTGKVTWKDNKPSGSCKAASCNIANSNKKPGTACKCLDGFVGAIKWIGDKATGSCKPAPCNIAFSNKKPGKDCKCNAPYKGTISWSGSVASGKCVKAGCGVKSGGFNADLVANIKAVKGWREVRNWRTSSNSELYESNGEFNNALGRFSPKETGYFLCAANVRLDGFQAASYSRLLITINGAKDVNNGLHTIEGRGGSTNYRSMMVTGTLMINKGQYASVYVYSSNDNSYTIQSESGFSCHRFSTKVGFHAEKNGNLPMGKGWKEISNFRTAGAAGLYNVGGTTASTNGFNNANGRFYAPVDGVYFCGAMVRMDGASTAGYFRLNMNLNGGADVNNGFHAIRGNKDSSNYGSLNIAGSVYLKKKQYLSLYAYSYSDNSWSVQSESGWGCHQMGTSIGFHADMSADQVFKRGWSRVTKWRTAGNNELYALKGGINTQGYYTAPEQGYYACASQVRIDAGSSTYFRLVIAINGQADVNNGLHAIDGAQGSTNYRTMRLAGTIYLKKGEKTSVHVYSATDNSYRVQHESGFSCHKFAPADKCATDTK